MKFYVSHMYCKYVIDTISITLKKNCDKKQNCILLEDKLYESYLMLEKLLNQEIS